MIIESSFTKIRVFKKNSDSRLKKHDYQTLKNLTFYNYLLLLIFIIIKSNNIFKYIIILLFILNEFEFVNNFITLF